MKNPNRPCNFTASYDQGYHFGYVQVHSQPVENARRLHAFVQEIDAFLVKMVALTSIIYDPWEVLGYARPQFIPPIDTSDVVPVRPVYTTRPPAPAGASSASDPPRSGGVVITLLPGGVVIATGPDVQGAAAAGLNEQDVQHASSFPDLHLEMTETKLRFLSRATLPRHLRRIALVEEQALFYLGT